MSKIKLDIHKLNAYIDNGYIYKTKHPEEDIYIYNYSQSTQFEKKWNESTLQCRGLILDKDYNVIAYPFSKFFNWSEIPDFRPTGNVRVYEKLDGSLGILYHHNGKWNWATRGSFTSSQAVMANAIWNNKYKHLESKLIEDQTYLFEIVGPDNRIVNSYPENDLILLGIMDRELQVEKRIEDSLIYDHVKCSKCHGEFNWDENLIETFSEHKDNFEGYVFVDSSGNRFKLKLQEYVRLHKILTGTNEIGIWESLKDGTSLTEKLDKIPDEFYDWVKEVETDLLEKYNEIENECKNWFEHISSYTDTRKEFALEVQKLSNYPSVLFNMYENKDYSEIIWKKLRPKIIQEFKK